MDNISKKQISMPKNIIVTTPKSQMNNAAQEAANCLQQGDNAYYFRKFHVKPKGLDIGSKMFYVEDGYIRGFGIVSKIEEDNKQCITTGKQHGNGFYAIMPANSWTWIKPIPMKGFQGYKYYENTNYEIVGNWRDSKPYIKKETQNEMEIQKEC